MKLETLVLRIGALTREAIVIARYERADVAPTIVWCNDALCALMGYAREEVLGQPSSMFRRVPAGGALSAQQVAAWSRGEETVSEALNYCKDGTELWLEHRIRPVLGEDGSLAYLIGFRHDVTERVRWRGLLEAEAARLRDERGRLESEAARFERLSLVATQIDDGVVFMNSTGLIEWANRAFLERSGRRLEDIVGRHAREIQQDHDLSLQQRADLERQIKEGRPVRLERRYIGSDGEPYWVDLSVQPVRDRDGTVTSRIAVGRDITERKKAEAEMAAAIARAEAAEQRLWSAIEAIPDGFVMYDADDRLLICNQRYRDFYLASDDALRVGTSFEEILHCGLRNGQYPDAMGCEEAWLAARIAAHQRAESSFEQALPDGRWLKIVERRTGTGDTVGFRVDITDLKQQQRQLENYAAQLEQVNLEMAEQHAALELSQETARHNALHDALTGLANRRYLDDRLRECLADQSADVALFHLDLDRFKQINDTLGHAAGDAVLVEVAERLRASVRSTDFVARIGGDEFVVLCPRATTQAELTRLADRLIQRLREPVPFENHLCRFGGSIGIAVRHAGDGNRGDLLVNADVALYRAKNRGRNRWEFYSDTIHAEMIARKKLSDEIVAGIETNAFLPYYQPQVCLTTGRLLGAEALARWQRPDGSVATPAQFLDVAEDLDLVARLDRMILENALADLRGWRARGLAIPRVSVNVSAKRLNDPMLVEDVRALDIPADWIAFELLESIYLDQPGSQILWTLDALRELGVPIELDDFGTGYSSIISLVRLRPDSIKIDQELVSPIVESEEAFALVRALVSIGATLGVRVLAEGVETAAHLDRLRQSGCQAVQGHHFGMPMPAAEFEALLRRTGGQLCTGIAVRQAV